MARGDVISDWDISIAAGASSSMQPGAGVEWMITQCWQGDNFADGELHGGAAKQIGSALYGDDAAPGGGTANLGYGTLSGHLMATNSEYPRIKNGSGSASRNFAYAGVQTK